MGSLASTGSGLGSRAAVTRGINLGGCVGQGGEPDRVEADSCHLGETSFGTCLELEKG